MQCKWDARRSTGASLAASGVQVDLHYQLNLVSRWRGGLSLVHHSLVVTVHVLTLQFSSPRYLLPYPTSVQRWHTLAEQDCKHALLSPTAGERERMVSIFDRTACLSATLGNRMVQ